MFESKGQPLAAPRNFALRLLRNALWSAGFIVVWLIIGMAGYGGLEGMSVVDSFVNAAMILSGMGPATVLQTDGGKIFAGLYALYSGLLIITITGFILAPVAHRVLHRFHVDLEDEEERPRPRKAKGPR